MAVFKVKWMTAPMIEHVYLRVFSARQPNTTFAALGNLTLRKDEFEDFKVAFPGAIYEREIPK